MHTYSPCESWGASVLITVEGEHVRSRYGVPACVEYEDGAFVVTDLVTLQFGTGGSEELAKRDCIDAVLDYIDVLRDAEGHMSWRMEQHLRALRAYVDLV
jgi:hypothetical protein